VRDVLLLISVRVGGETQGWLLLQLPRLSAARQDVAKLAPRVRMTFAARFGTRMRAGWPLKVVLERRAKAAARAPAPAPDLLALQLPARSALQAASAAMVPIWLCNKLQLEAFNTHRLSDTSLST
jgi:hypothetical protein